MEAIIMRGADLNVGAVTLIKDFSHPISIAHKVLTDSPHSVLGAEGAKIFALEKVSETFHFKYDFLKQIKNNKIMIL